MSSAGFSIALTKPAAIIALIVVLLFSTCSLFYLQHLKFEASADTLIDTKSKVYKDTQDMFENFDSEDFVLIIFQPKDKDIFSSQSLSYISDIEKNLLSIPGVKNTLSLASAPIFLGLDTLSSDIDPAELSWNAKKYASTFMHQSLHSHPLYENTLFNKSRTTLGIKVTLSQSGPAEQASYSEDNSHQSNYNGKGQGYGSVINDIRKYISDQQSQGTFMLGGGHVLALQIENIIYQDLFVFGGLSILVIGFFLWLFFREFRWVCIPLAGSLLAVVNTLGVISILDLKLTIISANVIALQIILTLAIFVHLIVEHQNQQSNNTESEESTLLLNTVREKFRPCFYAGLTSSIGFASLSISGIKPVESFGWMMVVAMTVSLTVSMIVFPALGLLLDRKKDGSDAQDGCETETDKEGWATLILRQSAVVANKFSLVCGVWALIFIIAALLVFTLEKDSSYLNYFKKSTDVHQELTYIDQAFGGSVPLDIVISLPSRRQESDLILTNNEFELLYRVGAYLEKRDSVGHHASLDNILNIAHAINGKPLAEYEVSAFFKLLDKSITTKIISPYYSEATNKLRISIRIMDSADDLNRTEFIVDLNDFLEQTINRIYKNNSDVTFNLTNAFVLYEKVLNKLLSSQMETLGVVYLAMFLLLWYIFRSFSIACITVVPNLVTTVLLFGLMALLSIPLDLMTITIAAVAMGISVDDTIHYVHQYQKTDQDRSLKTNLSIGRALMYSTIIISFGFGMLVFSDFVPTANFGLLSALAMIIALIADLTLLPALLDRFFKPRQLR